MSEQQEYFKIEILHEPGSGLIIDPRKPQDLSALIGGEIGDRYIITVIEMTPEKFKMLPEWSGF